MNKIELNFLSTRKLFSFIFFFIPRNTPKLCTQCSCSVSVSIFDGKNSMIHENNTFDITSKWCSISKLFTLWSFISSISKSLQTDGCLNAVWWAQNSNRSNVRQKIAQPHFMQQMWKSVNTKVEASTMNVSGRLPMQTFKLQLHHSCIKVHVTKLCD